MKNVIRVYRKLFQSYPSLCWQTPVHVILKVASPLLESAIPAMAVAMILEKNISRYVVGISILILLDFVVRTAGTLLEQYFENYIAATRSIDFWVEFLKKNLTMDYCNVEPAAKRDKIEKGRNAVNANWVGVENLMRNAFGLVCYSFGLLSYGAIILMVDVRVLLIMVVMTVVSFCLHRYAVQYADKNSRERDFANRAIGLMAWEARQPEYGKDIRIYHVEYWFKQLFDEYMGRLLRWHRRVEFHWYFPTVSDTVFGFARDVLLYSVLLGNVLQGTMTVTEFVFYTGIVAGFSSWLSQFLFKISAVMKANLETKAYYEVLEDKDVFLHGEGEVLDVTAPVSIEFRNVSFRYEEGEEILSHLSFRIERGQKIALVGNNGAGKTTIVKLLCGFYLPTEGEVLINGISIDKYDMENYRQGISAVFQDGFLSALPVVMNVAGGNEEKIDRARVRKCLKRAGIWDKISSLPGKEDSCISQMLDKNGVDFSGGERQKLLIARALYQDGRVLILDEPTSALDPIAERSIYEKYNELTEGRTSLFISHRLASTKFCDEILFLERGKVVERGTHEELLKRKGKYAEMFEIQSHYYKEEVAKA